MKLLIEGSRAMSRINQKKVLLTAIYRHIFVSLALMEL